MLFFFGGMHVAAVPVVWAAVGGSSLPMFGHYLGIRSTGDGWLHLVPFSSVVVSLLHYDVGMGHFDYSKIEKKKRNWYVRSLLRGVSRIMPAALRVVLG